MVDDGIVGDLGKLGISRGGALEQEGSEEDVVELQGVVLLDDLSVNIGNEEKSSQEEQTEASTEGDTGNVPARLVVEAELGRSLIDD